MMLNGFPGTEREQVPVLVFQSRDPNYLKYYTFFETHNKLLNLLVFVLFFHLHLEVNILLVIK